MTSHNMLMSGLAKSNWVFTCSSLYKFLEKQCLGETDATRAIKCSL